VKTHPSGLWQFKMDSVMYQAQQIWPLLSLFCFHILVKED